MLTPAHVHGLAFHPPFSLPADRFGYLFQGFVAVLPLVIDDDKVRTVHPPHFPVGGVVHSVIDTLHDHGHVFTRSRCQREHRLGVPVGGLQHKKTSHQALDAVKLQIIYPLLAALLLRGVPFGQPVALTLKVHPVIHVQGDIFVMRERECQDIVTLYLLHLGGAVTRLYIGPSVAVAVIDGQHVCILFKRRLNRV